MPVQKPFEREKCLSVFNQRLKFIFYMKKFTALLTLFCIFCQVAQSYEYYTKGGGSSQWSKAEWASDLNGTKAPKGGPSSSADSVIMNRDMVVDKDLNLSKIHIWMNNKLEATGRTIKLNMFSMHSVGVILDFKKTKMEVKGTIKTIVYDRESNKDPSKILLEDSSIVAKSAMNCEISSAKLAKNGAKGIVIDAKGDSLFSASDLILDPLFRDSENGMPFNMIVSDKNGKMGRIEFDEAEFNGLILQVNPSSDLRKGTYPVLCVSASKNKAAKLFEGLKMSINGKTVKLEEEVSLGKNKAYLELGRAPKSGSAITLVVK